MQIQVNTDNHIDGSTELTGNVEEVVSSALGRFSERITRVEVHLTDESSSAKNRGNDMRCVMEARLTGMQPMTVRENGATVDLVTRGAAEKLARAIRHTLDRLNETKGRTSFAGEETS